MIDFLNLKQITALHADEIHQAASRVIDSGWYLKGIETQQFEEAYARYIGTRYCIGVANGLDALTLIFRAYLEMGLMMPGDEVIVPANTYIASILSVSECGLTPVLVEPRLDTLEIDDSLIEEAITPRTRAVMIVHLYGRCAYTERIAVLCQQHGLKLIEDNAQAHGCIVPAVRYDAMLHPQKAVSPSNAVRYDATSLHPQKAVSPSNAVRYDATSLHPQKTGSLGDAAGHSFYPGKNLGALGDAGAVTTNDDQLAAVVRSIANYGSSRKYVFDYCGRNSRIDELQAAILSVKLRHLDDDNRHRQQIAAYYYDHIQHPEVALPARLPDAQNVYHLFPVFTPRRDDLQAHLAEQGIQTLIHYPIPPHRQRCYRHWPSLSLPITEQIHQQELSLPISPVMTMEEARQVVEGVNGWKAK